MTQLAPAAQDSSALLIDGVWCSGTSGRTVPVVNPATGETLWHLPLAGSDDLDRALDAASRGFAQWRRISAYDRSRILHEAARLLRERSVAIATLITREQGKPLVEASLEVAASADIIVWYAEEGRRAYGRLIPARAERIRQMVRREPVGPVAAFTPWNFPLGQAVRKVAAALAAGCSIILKPPEETPSSCIELCRCFHDAGLPAGALNLVFGEPAAVSAHLIAADAIRKLSFTGSIAVGKQLGVLAARHGKRTTMELGGHAPLIVFEDADVPAAAALAVQMKFRNAGQICASPSRFFVQDAVHDQFAHEFTEAARRLKVGDGFAAETQMGPLANARRLDAMQRLVGDAVACGASLLAGGERVGERGNFFAPTVLADVPAHAALLHEEPFGPVAPMLRFTSFEEVVARANTLPHGLAAYAFTRSLSLSEAIAAELDCGMVSINHAGLALPETPFGGVKESGHGSEGGSEGLDAYLVSKFVSEKAA